MSPDDDTRKLPAPEGDETIRMPSADDTVRMPAGPGAGGPPGGDGPGGAAPGGGPNPPSPKAKLLIILTVAGVIILGGIIVLLIHLLGGDEPAPVVVTRTQTQTETVTRAATIQSQTRTRARTQAQGGRPEPPPTGDIYSVDWNAMLSPGSSGGYIEDVMYQDLTGDGIDEAVVTIRYQGSGAYLDYYVYTYQGSELVNLFADYDISHGYVNFGSLPGSIVVDEPIYGPDDPNCCPSQLQHITYTWSASARVFVETNVVVEDNPAS